MSIILVLLLVNAQAAEKYTQVPISTATAKSIHGLYRPNSAYDGDVKTFYHSGLPCEDTQWLRLKLANEVNVAYVEIVNR